ncbi:GNAT family N-acetyltransferase [Paenalkalicoccus suaedae]|uniref:GNAT family N-acetyltransferase n=1 Tax=Paenalkalicoccus suaedae TaxID=2592382 RepID=A0A859FIV8_9BACI|nr:GNAT family N-acetyltransferase [Paenalkalicoccus suaedae]QKS72858.1 GNAT family N-acetyltransferase [Paenalkalicoccus suaedae]
MVRHIEIRTYKESDFDDLLSIQKEAFPPPFPEELWWSKQHISAHVNTFPDGAMIAYVDGDPAGSATSLITTLSDEAHSWEEIADDGYITRTHVANGDTLYGIDVCVRPTYRGKGIAAALYDARKQLVRDLGLARYVAGCRIPNYYEYAEQMDVATYVEHVVAGDIHDLVLSFMLKQGLHPVRILPNYVEDDESLNYAVLVEWRNDTL